MSDQFRRNLQAWTEAQVRALLRRQIRVRTRGKPLIDDINALLTDRIASALEYLRGKDLPSEFLTDGTRNDWWKNVSDVMASGLFWGQNEAPYTDGFFASVANVYKQGLNFFRTELQNTTSLLDSLAFDYKAGFEPMPCTIISDDDWTGPITAYAGMYTGEMRKVAQMLYGMGVVVPYSYCAEKTHGIYTAESGAKWVIEISVDDGITAWPLETIAGIKQLNLTHIPVAVESLPELEDRVLLASPDILADYAGWGAAYSECGWAFSSSGADAVNVAYEFVDTASVYARKTHLLKITITGDEDTPTEATISEVDSAYLYCKNHDYFSIKFPHYRGTDGAQLESLFTSYPAAKAPETYDNAPIHAWYDDETLIVVRQRTLYEYEETLDEEAENPTEHAGCFYSDIGWPGISGSGSIEVGQYRKEEVCWAEIDNGTGGFDAPDQAWLSKPEKLDYSWADGGPAVYAISRDDPWNGQYGIASESRFLSETHSLYAFDAPQIYEVVIIPFHERQGVYIYRTISESGGETVTERSTESTYGAGTFELRDPFNAEAFCWPLIGFTCACNGDGSTGKQYIGQWGTGATMAITNPAASIGTGAPNGKSLELYGSDPNYPSLTLWCYVDGSLPSCAADLVVTESAVGPTTSDYKELRFTDGVTSRTLFSENEFDFNNDLCKRTDNIFSPIYGQWIDTHLDVFTGEGSLATAMNGTLFSDRLVTSDLVTSYPVDEIVTRSSGWFGIPFPEKM